MYIPNKIVSKVQKVAGRSLATISGEILTYKDECFKIVAVTAQGITVETIENDTQVDRLFTFDMVA